MSQEIENRVIRDYKQWEDREQRYEKLIPGNTHYNKAFLKEKLHFITSLPEKYKETLTADEKMAITALERPRKEIERRLYPSILQRILNRLLGNFKVKQQVAKIQKDSSFNILNLNNQLGNLGFDNQLQNIKASISLGKDAFSLPYSQFYNGNESINYELVFQKDGNEQYQLTNIKAALNKEELPGGKIEHTFNLKEGIYIDNSRAYNLLSGRQVLSVPENINSSMVGLDFNDKDADGNHRLKTFNHSYSNSLVQMLKELPKEFKENQQHFQMLQKSLGNGDLAEWLTIKDGVQQKFFMRADPKLGKIVFYNQKLKETDVNTVLGKQNATIIQLTKTEDVNQAIKKAKVAKKSLGV